MKRTDLEKLNASKLQSRMRQAGAQPRFHHAADNPGAKSLNPLIEKLLRKGLGETGDS